MRRRTLQAGVVLVVALTACSADGGSRETGLVQVAAAFYPIVEAASRIGGERVDVLNLTPPGVEPHDIELSPGQIGEVLNAELLLYLGGGFQPAVEELAKRRNGGSVNLLGGGDPHIWLDPAAWSEAVGEIAEALSEADPAGRDAFAANVDAYRAELNALDANFRAGLRDCTRRVVVTAHRSFGRLAARYRLEEIAIAGASPDGEPSAQHLAELRKVVRDKGVTTIFTEELLSPKVAETLARETGARTAVLDPIESLTEDALRAGKNYLSQMLSNLDTLRRALECR